MTAPPPLIARLADLIRGSGLNQPQIAAAAGMRQSAISQLLSGDRGGRVPADTVARLARAMGLSATALGRLLYDSLPAAEKIPEKNHNRD